MFFEFPNEWVVFIIVILNFHDYENSQRKLIYFIYRFDYYTIGNEKEIYNSIMILWRTFEDDIRYLFCFRYWCVEKTENYSILEKKFGDGIRRIEVLLQMHVQGEKKIKIDSCRGWTGVDFWLLTYLFFFMDVRNIFPGASVHNKTSKLDIMITNYVRKTIMKE